MRTVRSAGFDPLGPPLREGTTYVLRATDYRGILMHVVLDARTGVIRDVTRIVPAGSGRYGMMPPPYGPPAYPPPYGPPAEEVYGSPLEYQGPPQGEPVGDNAPMQAAPPDSSFHAARPAAAVHPSSPPLPRPRPAALTAKDAVSAQAATKRQPLPVTTAKHDDGIKTPAASAGVSSVQAAPKVVPPLKDFND